MINQHTMAKQVKLKAAMVSREEAKQLLSRKTFKGSNINFILQVREDTKHHH